MPLNPDLLLGLPPIETRYVLTPRDVILYALGVGATELPFVYEDGLVALPTLALVLGWPGFFWKEDRYRVQWQHVLHGESSIELHQPMPIEGEFIGSTTFGPIFDKGEKGAMVYQTRTLHHGDGTHVATVRSCSVLRADGGFGGTATGQPRLHPVPDCAPDIDHVLPTWPHQALIYRLSGDDNPLHVDPAVARMAGFSGPILHGMCTFGIAGRSLLAALCGNQPARLTRVDARYSAPVFPGETIRTDIWRQGEGKAAFRSTAIERGVVVLNNGFATFEEGVPVR